MVEVKIRKLRKEFKDGANTIVAINDVDLSISDGEFVTLVGPSGCGKTTTLRCVAGLESPTSGTIHFGEKDVTYLPPQERDVALLFQDIALYPHMTILQNIAYGLRIDGVPKAERHEKAREAAETLQIKDQLDKKPADLSGGQQQRAALGRSIVRDPSLFLFDEPMSDLDEKLKRELRPVIQQVTRRVGCPVLYVTHDQEEAMTLSDKIAVMNNGDIEQLGTPSEVYNNPESAFVASFIGQPVTQFFDATLEANNDTVMFEMGGSITVPLEVPPGSLNGYIGRDIRGGIRPQYINVTDDPAEGIHAEHILDDPLGDETHSYFDTEFGDIITVTPPEFKGEQREYGLKLTPEHIQLFDPDSGVRIA